MASRSVTSRAPETLSSSLTRIDRKIHPKTIDVSVHWVSELGYTDTMEKMTLGEIQDKLYQMALDLEKIHSALVESHNGLCEKLVSQALQRIVSAESRISDEPDES